jgi:RNA polymerase sigma-70 factor, ECF subfamily
MLAVRDAPGPEETLQTGLSRTRRRAMLAEAMATDTNDLDWALARARAGDEAGFLTLWRSLHPRLLRYLRVLGCDDPDDVGSETWLQVVRDLQRFDGDEAAFRHWLFSVGRHRAIDAARARSRRRASPVAERLEAVADDQTVEDQVLDGLSVRRAIAMLASLSADQAEAVALRVIAGLDTTAVAQILGKSPGAVQVALHRGLRALAADPQVRALATEPGPGRHGADASPGLGWTAPGTGLLRLGEVD